MAITRKQVIGKWGEDLAEAFLLERGFTILARNYRTPYGELDIVSRKMDEIIFVEVKTRTNGAFGLPEEAVTPRKRSHLIDAAQHFLLQKQECTCDWHIDVIAIIGQPNQPNPQVEWFENAFS